MSDSTPEKGKGAASTAKRFPAPRPKSSATAPGVAASSTTTSRPVPARPSGQSTAAAPRVPSAATGTKARPQPTLVRPTPKAKVRKARLLISKVDPWSVLKMSFLLSVALGIMTVVAAVSLWSVMDITGIFGRVNDLAEQILGSEPGEQSFAIENMISIGQVASFATIIAVVNVVFLTVLSMLAAVLYNLSASLVGGVGVTLTDD